MTDTKAIVESYRKLADENARKRGASDTIKSMIADNSKKLSELNKKQQDISDEIILVQRFSEGIQTGVVGKFEDLLTRGVRQIFDKEYTVTIEFSTSGNTLNADFFITLPDGKKVNLASGEGGGLRDLVAVLQRILYVVLEPSRPSRVVFMDENMKMLDSARAPGAFSFLRDLCRELDVQVVWVTHQESAKNLEGENTKVISIGS